jgi:hypothetical protein
MVVGEWVGGFVIKVKMANIPTLIKVIFFKDI